ncbi:hypothetical protein JR316_0001541 [Psilocybe cubensis]|uniref:Uncharacterized protein n=1 Tax=Psilocybe cubensis TaxID=181762 RepID=A0ACB8HHG1_PSICU|nr:hypothetical protein JR316_0001541 [Psilocybe cubensis]KAH9487465.1 hypothetical protein JR316_0001541 [Psilocybe cubensis]
MFKTPLPTELSLLILSYLPLSSIRSLILTNTEWAAFVDQNQSTVYRNAAAVEGYIEASAKFVYVDEVVAHPEGKRDNRRSYSQHSMKGVEGWRSFCQRRKLVERSWAGRAPSRVVDVLDPPHYKRVHRIKVDENAGITIATTQLGGLLVRDLESDVVLWELPVWYVRQYAHLEYGQGYMIFDRDDGNKEVWRRIADSSANEQLEDPEFEPKSAPDERQKHVVNYIAHLTPNFPPANSSSSASNFKARFAPHAVLHMPEITRAYRYVYPTLLVASLERAYLWDVRTGKLQQMISGIQVISMPEEEDTQGHEHGNDGAESDDDDEEEEESGAGNPDNHISAQQELMPHDIDLMDVLPRLNPARILDQSSEQAGANGDTDPIDDSEDEELSMTSEDEDEAVQLPRFLGLVRYVDLSERHVFFAGRYLLRIFSRETGKCVMDIPSTRWRYGKWRWEIASRKSATATDLDSYEKAKKEEREAVRMPVRFSLEEYPRGGGRVVIDQFIAGPPPVVAPPPPSSKGKETSTSTSTSATNSRRPQLSNRSTANSTENVPPMSFDPVFFMPGSFPGPFSGPSTSTSNAAASSSSQTRDEASRARIRRRNARRKRRQRHREAREMRRRAKDAKDEEIFEHTIDVQLGAPSASSGIYLAYENGRIGIVTSNAIYIVIPPIPPPPSASNASTPLGIRRNRTIDVPKLEVMRLPFFSNPSWLCEVSCLMMSDTGLFVNWNPLWPRMVGDEVQLAERVWEDEEDQSELNLDVDSDDYEPMEWELEDMEFAGDGDEVAGPSVDRRSGGNAHQMRNAREEDREAVDALVSELLPLRQRRDPEWQRQHQDNRQEEMMRQWEREYEDDLLHYELSENERYHHVVESEVSTIYRVDFAPYSNGA